MSKKKKDSLKLRLDGKIWIIDRSNGKKTKTELDGKLVLQCLVSVIEQSLDNMGVK